MGASEFMTAAKGKTAKDAFQAAHDSAAWESGHGGYTGTIAEKRDFRMVPVPAGADPKEHVHKLMTEYDEALDGFGLTPKHDGFWHDKWGPAGCVKVADDEWLFFGWASS